MIKKMFSLLTPIFLIIMLIGCGGGLDDGSSNNSNGTNTNSGGGPTATPEDIRGRWFDVNRFDDQYDEMQAADIVFTEDKFSRGEVGVWWLVRVTGKKIECASVQDTEFQLALLLCNSYTISNDGVLSFSGGGMGNDGTSYKQLPTTP